MGRRLRANHLMVTALIIGLVGTAIVLISAEVPLVVRSPALQAVVETTGGIATLSAALMVYGRFRTNPTVGMGTLLASLLTFGLTNIFLAATPAAFATIGPNYDTWGALVARMIATLLFAAASLLNGRRRMSTAVPLLGSVSLIVIVAAVCRIAGSRLPPAVALLGDITSVTDLRAHPAVVAVNLIGLLAFLLAAWGFSRRADDLFQALAGASVLAAFSRLHLSLVPSLYTGAVYSGDIFRLAFHALVLLAAIGEVTRYWRDREALAVAEERRRVARDLHDGMAQELAFIASTANRMASKDDGGDVILLASSARRALDESRRAIATLTRPVEESLQSALAETLHEVAGRTGGVVDMDLDARADVSPIQREELLRIAREAVANALRHSGDSAAKVTLTGGETITLVITDRGRGFDVDAPTNRYGFGLVSMRERAMSLGATFDISSHPGAGTTVTVTL